jgi:hypothetical protein
MNLITAVTAMQRGRDMVGGVPAVGKEVPAMAAIPPGPQEPFSKDRAYGQEPGFVSRNTGKLYLVLALLVIAGIAAVLWVSFADGGSNDPYGDNREPTTQR